MSFFSATRGVPVPLLVDETDDEITSPPLGIPSSFSQHKISITSGAGVASGAVTVESAPAPDYAGTWSPITSAINAPAASSVIEYNFSGIFNALRARISTVIGGGTISVEYVGS